MTEICDRLLVEDGENRALFVAAVEALKNLALTDGDCAEIVLTFSLVALHEAGYMLDADGCGVCGGEIGENAYFDFGAGYFTCADCASGTRASRSTYHVLRKCAGLDYDETGTDDGRKRALRLVRAYLTEKTEEEYPCFSELIRLYE